MDTMNSTLDKTYVMFVLETMDITPYQLSKMTGISNATFSHLLNGKHGLKWSSIAKIENETGIEFKSPKHLIYASEQSFCPHSTQNKRTKNGQQKN